ncbi:MAG: ATP-binding protein [Lachnospiraceae bacterium]|nr:ATP-binding protein [Lachnospiraceae bacterium]
MINRQLKTPARLSQLEEVLAFLEQVLEECGCPMKVVTQICVSVEEIFVNVANYAYPDDVGECVLDMEVTPVGTNQKGRAQICISDDGKPFDPLAKSDPDITLTAEERNIGGLGIWMVKQSMDHVEYEYVNHQNKLTLVKTW